MKVFCFKPKGLVLVLLTLLSWQPAFSQVYARNGMVVSDNQIASEVGRSILQKGGNAIDATVATAFALAVVHPQAGNIGGGGFIVYMDAKSQVTTIDFREKAPLKASTEMFLDANGKLIPNANHSGIKTVGVPGTVAGLYLAHQKYGKLKWEELVQPAIRLAKKGIPLPWTLTLDAKRFNKSSEPKFIRNLFLNKKGEPTKFGENWKQPALAKTLKQIKNKGRNGFYTGKVAENIADFMAENGGLITKEDLAKYQAIERSPIHGTYKEFDIYSMPPPSSGGVVLVEMLNLLENIDFSKIEFNSAQYVHVLAETMRRAYADRAEHLGDPDFNLNIPLDKLLSKDFAKSRYQNIDFQKASKSDSTKFGQLYDGTNTTHFSIIDKDGNAVSMTYTLEYSYGSKIGAPELGFIFNNEMGDFNPQPGYTNRGWLIGTQPNIIEPQKRMLSSMTPTIVAKEGKPHLIIGSPGGRTIINTVFQTVVNVIEFEMPLKMAIESMKIHHQWMPDQIYYEMGLLSPDTKSKLEHMGHKFVGRGNLGRLMGIFVDHKNKIYHGVSDSSSPDGAAIGY